MPYQLVFISRPSDMLVNFAYMVDLIFVVDIMVNFLTCYYSYEGQLIT